jgi:hypothetical protein
MKTVSGVLPWAVVMAAVGGLIWWMIARDMGAGKWLLGGLLFAHGAVHLMFAVPEPENGSEWPFNMDRSWLITGGGSDASQIRMVGWVFIAITVAGFLMAALATVGIVVPVEWWRPMVIVASVASGLTLVTFFDPQLILGIGIDAVLVWAAVAGSWSP